MFSGIAHLDTGIFRLSDADQELFPPFQAENDLVCGHTEYGDHHDQFSAQLENETACAHGFAAAVHDSLDHRHFGHRTELAADGVRLLQFHHALRLGVDHDSLYLLTCGSSRTGSAIQDRQQSGLSGHLFCSTGSFLEDFVRKGTCYV